SLPRRKTPPERFANDRPALHANVAPFPRDHFVKPGHVEEHTAFERHRLPVIARAAAPQRQWNFVPDGCRHHRGDFLLTLGADHDVGHAILELRRKHRAVPVKVVGLLANFARINARADIANIVSELLDEPVTCHLVLAALAARRSAMPPSWTRAANDKNENKARPGGSQTPHPRRNPGNNGSGRNASASP